MQEKILNSLFYFIGWFALWTMGSNWVSYNGLDSQYLIPWFVFSLSVLVITVYITRKKQLIYPIEKVLIINLDQLDLIKLRFSWIVMILIMGLLIACYLYKFHSIWSFFLSLSFLTGILYYNFSREKNIVLESCSNSTAGQDRLDLVSILILLLVFYFFGHQPDYDDANFINLGMGAFRSDAGVFIKDTMLGDGITNIHLDIYKVQSYELLHGTLGEIFPGEAIFYAHIFLPFFFIGVYSTVLFLIYKPILKKYWLLGAILHLIFLIISIDSYQSFGAHGIFRFFQGKIFFIQVLIPLLIYMVVAHYRKPSLQSWLFLFCIQVGSVGMTVNAVYVAPMTVGLSLFPFFLKKPLCLQNFKRLLIILATCLYPLFIGLLLAQHEKTGSKPGEVPGISDSSHYWTTLYNLLGWNFYGILIIGIFPLCIYMCARLSQNWYPIAYLAGLLLFVVNPLFLPFYKFLVGHLASRVYWSIPFSIIFSIGLSVLIVSFYQSFKPFTLIVKKLAMTTAVIILIVVIIDKTVIREETIAINWGLPYYRVDKDDYEIAKLVAETTVQPCTALVPSNIARNLTIIENHPYPIAVSMLYQGIYGSGMEPKSLAMRTMLLQSVSSDQALVISDLQVAEAIEKYNIGLILILNSHINQSIFEQVSNAFGFDKKITGNYTLYHRGCNEKKY